MVPQSHAIKHSVSIYPDGYREGVEPAQLVLYSQEAKDQYVKDEYKYCIKEVTAYNAARTLEDRKEAQKVLFSKRVQFALTQGYAPKPGSPNTWVKQPFHHGDNVA